MTFLFKSLGLFLAAVLLVSSTAVRSLDLHIQPADSPAGCHEHGGKTPGHAPSYKCCLTGHDVAIVKVLHGPQLESRCQQAEAGERPVLVAEVSKLILPVLIQSSAPPGPISLRV